MTTMKTLSLVSFLESLVPRNGFWLLIFFLIIFVYCPGTSEMHFSKSIMPKFTDLDMVEIYYLRSFPYQAIMSEAGSFKVQTSGLALRSSLTLEVIVLEYKPLNITACFLPLVDHGDQGDDDGPHNDTLLWDKRAIIAYETEIDSKYWQQSTFLGRINGIVYRNYINWLEEYKASAIAKYFVPESICSNADEESCFTMPHTGDQIRIFQFHTP